MKSFVIWLIRPWPFLLIIPFLVAHILLLKLPCMFSSESLKFLCWSNHDINKFISLAMQLIGGLLVLYSINSNIWALKNQNLTNLIKSWLIACPLVKRKNTVLEISDLKSDLILSTISLQYYKIAKTNEEKIEYLLQEIKSIKEGYKSEIWDIRKQIEYVRSEINSSCHTNSIKLFDLNRKIEDITLGGFQMQLLGIMLVFYGSVCEYFS